MWVIGGDGHTDVWSSSDGFRWTRATADAPWGRRYKPYVVVFKDRLWLMGGQDIFRPDYVPFGDNYTAYNDVWSSVDGIQWRQVVERAPWPPRGMIHGSAIFQNRIWILGGGLYANPGIYYNDVWSSADGEVWHRVTDKAPWLPRLHHNVAVYADRLWIMGGHDSDLESNANDVWTSADGVSWSQQPPAPWTPRHASSTFVFDDALWLVAGYLVNDVWQLRTPGRVSINGGARATSSREVAVTLSAPAGEWTHAQLSNDGVRWSLPLRVDADARWVLKKGQGRQTVFARFSNAAGGWSDLYQDSISLAAPAAIRLSAPTGGERWHAGESRFISWIAAETIARVDLEFRSEDSGSWQSIATDVPAAAGRFRWQLPQTACRSCRVRVLASATGTSVAMSARFAVAGGRFAPTAWQVGSLQQITWATPPDIATVRVETSADDGARWKTIARVPSGAGRLSWRVPNRVSRAFRVQVSDAATGRILQQTSRFPVFRALDGLVAAYPLDGSAVDATRNGFDGVVHDAVPTEDRFGNASGAYRFNGTSASIDVSGLPISSRDEFSLAFWVQTRSARRMHAVSFGTAIPQNLDFNFNDPTGSLWLYWNSAGDPQIRTGDLNLPDGAWHHVAMKRSGETLELYVDGTRRGASRHVGPLGDTGLLRIGRGSYDEHWWDGVIDDVRIFNRPLEIREIEALSKDRR
jgi:hypothetical protein